LRIFALAMRIAVLSDPNNFHTQKWVKALQLAGAEVVVISYDPAEGLEFEAVQLTPPSGKKGVFSYLDYLRGGKVLREALVKFKIDVVNPLNVTPFGVWAMQAGFHPTVACAFGADILEYPPRYRDSPQRQNRGWEAQSQSTSKFARWKAWWKWRFFKRKVFAALAFADWITGDNQHLLEAMRNWFQVPADKLTLLPFGLEPELFQISPFEAKNLRNQFKITRGQPVVLSARGAKPIYQADIILDAISLLLSGGDHSTRFIFLSAGYAVDEEVRQKAVFLENSNPNFSFVPTALPRETMYGLWNLVDVFISAPVYDGYSAVLAEGRYIGAIPIVNDIPGNRELIEHGQNGWITSPFTADQLCSDLRLLLGDLQFYKEKFAGPNRAWIVEHSLIDKNVQLFLQQLSLRFHTA
jgi:glycosyltransferase involved in cell wall biosynthesis